MPHFSNKKKANSCKKRFCPRCLKRFCRLDTHLRSSATCRLVVSSDKAFLTNPSPSAVEDGSVSPSPNTLSTQPLTEPLESCYSPQPQTSPVDTTPDSVSKPRPCLPVSDDDWEKANTYFKNNTVPCVLSELSVDAKYTALADGIYNYFAGVYGTRKIQHKHRTRHKKLASRVKEAKSLKNAARRELNRVKKEPSISQEQINSIAHKFFKSVRSHNKLTTEYRHFQHKAESRAARHQCLTNLWQFTKDLLEDKPATNVHPTFSETEATSFFSKAYHSEPRRYTQPSWMPSATAPVAEFNENDITLEEITLAVKKARSKSSPSPFDGIPYTVFKKCPALLSALHNIFNLQYAGHAPQFLLLGRWQQLNLLLNPQHKQIHLCQVTSGQ